MSPGGVRIADQAFVTFLMRNDSYLPGALVLAHALRKQQAGADRVRDLVCLATPEITRDARYALGQLYDHVVDVPPIYVPHKRRQKRQDRPYMFTRLNALRLGADGDLGFRYAKIALLDADLLPLRGYGQLFDVPAPAGILNEHRSHLIEVDEAGQYVIPPSVEVDGTWVWHRLYEGLCPHGERIPREITDRVAADPANLGILGALFVLEPSMDEYRCIEDDVQQPEVLRLVGDLWDWPEMQYLTVRWSGRWSNLDARYAGLNGYPCLSVLYGTHFAGLKPWQVNKGSVAHYARYDDYQRWYREYVELVTEACPQLREVRRLERLLAGVGELLA